MKDNLFKIYLHDLYHFLHFKEIELFTLSFLFLKYLQKNKRNENSERDFILFINNGNIIEILDKEEYAIVGMFYSSYIGYSDYKYNKERFRNYLRYLDDKNISEALIYISKYIKSDELKIPHNFVEFIKWFIMNNTKSDDLTVLEYMGSDFDDMSILLNTLKIEEYDYVTHSYLDFYTREILSRVVNHQHVKNYKFDFSCNSDVLLHKKFDFIYSLFPWNLTFDNNQLDKVLASDTYITNDYKSIYYLYSKLKSDSYGLVFVYENIINSKKFSEDRKRFIKTNAINSIIRLPKKSIDNFSGFVYLLILSKDNIVLNLFDFSEFYEIRNNKVSILVDNFVESYSTRDDKYFRELSYKELDLMNFNINFKSIFGDYE